MKFTITLLIMIVFPLQAAILHVPAEFNTIQSGIDSAEEGDTVLVSAGIFFENIQFDGKNITLLSESGSDQTIIDGSMSGSVVEFTGGETEHAVLDGFTIQNGSGTIISLIFGGGILIRDGNPTLLNLIITNNTAFAGGGIAYYATTPTGLNALIENCLIQNNLASEGGGIFGANISPVIENTQIIANGMDDNGSGGGMNTILAHPVLHNVEISGNDTKWGGGIYCAGGGITLENVLISGNTAIMHGAGAWIGQNSVVRADKVTIVDNHAQSYGGGLWLTENPNAQFVNMTISGNSAVGGGGIYLSESEAVLLNSILWNNAPQQVLLEDDPGVLDIAFSDVQDGENGVQVNSGIMNWLDGNMDSDPLFNDDFSLSESSPCVDAGTSQYEWNGETILDLSSNDYFGTGPDMGAHESEFENGESLPGDVNGDGAVNVVDVVLAVSFILGESTPNDDEFSAADVNGDGSINVVDIVQMVNIILS